MIESFAHKGLKRLYEKDDARGVSAEHVEKITLILTTLDAAETIEAMNLPSFRLHRLTGDLKGFWSVTVYIRWLQRVRVAARDVHLLLSDVDLDRRPDQFPHFGQRAQGSEVPD